MNLKKKYKVYLMHHSHTDIGYTKSPESTINEQVEYIRYITKKLTKNNSEQNNESENFKWICESFIIVEKFLENASDSEVADFIKLVQEGRIEITAMYANLAEVLDANILDRMIKRSITTGEKYKVDIKVAMNADINGLSRDYAKKMSQNGIHNYYIAVHTHHGMYPLFEKQSYFRWDLQDGDYLNVWNGEHYMFGNGFAFSKGAIALHGFFDNVDFKKYNQSTDNSWIELAETRFEKYITQLEKDGYQYDFIPLTIHGKFTDNSMPNFDIANRVKEWNQKNKDEIEVIMCTLSEFFEEANKIADIPTYCGEWPDWWTDGVISAPAQLKLFKNAQTQYNKLLELASANNQYTNHCKDIDYNLTMYAEHTYGSFDSISNPYHDFTHRQWALKQNYLSNALREIDKLEHKVLKDFGNDTTNHNVPNQFKIINSANHRVNQVLQLPFANSDADSLSGNYKISDEFGNEYEYALTDDWRKFPIVDVTLNSNEQIILNVKSDLNDLNEERPYFSRINYRGSDNVVDLNNNQDCIVTQANEMYNQSIKLSWDNDGIKSIKCDDVEILDGSNGLLNVVHELSKVERHTLGRNRKGTDVIRSFGKLNESKVIEKNNLYTVLKQNYTVNGFNEYTLYVKLFSTKKTIEFKVQCEKDISSDVENVYLDLPFICKDASIAKTSSAMTIWDDQLPGTLTDYYSAFKGIKFGNSTMLTTPDTQLIQVGPIDNQNRILYGDKLLSQQTKNYYIWLMSNYWETNFVKSLAGFYEFNFKLDLNADTQTLEQVADELIVFPVFEEVNENN